MKAEGGEKIMRTEKGNNGRHVGRKVEEECTDKKKKHFPHIQYKEIQKGAVAKSYMTYGLLIS